jgi:hypothetical protein
VILIGIDGQKGQVTQEMIDVFQLIESRQVVGMDVLLQLRNDMDVMRLLLGEHGQHVMQKEIRQGLALQDMEIGHHVVVRVEQNIKMGSVGQMMVLDVGHQLVIRIVLGQLLECMINDVLGHVVVLQAVVLRVVNRLKR